MTFLMRLYTSMLCPIPSNIFLAFFISYANMQVVMCSVCNLCHYLLIFSGGGGFIPTCFNIQVLGGDPPLFFRYEGSSQEFCLRPHNAHVSYEVTKSRFFSEITVIHRPLWDILSSRRPRHF